MEGALVHDPGLVPDWASALAIQAARCGPNCWASAVKPSWAAWLALGDGGEESGPGGGFLGGQLGFEAVDVDVVGEDSKPQFSAVVLIAGFDAHWQQQQRHRGRRRVEELAGGRQRRAVRDCGEVGGRDRQRGGRIVARVAQGGGVGNGGF